MDNSARAHSFLVPKTHKNHSKKSAMVQFFLEPNNQQILPTRSEKQNSPHQLPLLIEFYLPVNAFLQIRDWYRSKMKDPRDGSPLLAYPILNGSCLTLNSPPQGSFILLMSEEFTRRITHSPNHQKEYINASPAHQTPPRRGGL